MELSNLMPACAKVYDDTSDTNRGTAFLISSRRAITAAHVASNIRSPRLQFATDSHSAVVERSDSVADVALLLLDKPVEGISPLSISRTFFADGPGYTFGLTDPPLADPLLHGKFRVANRSRASQKVAPYFVLQTRLGTDIVKRLSGAPLLIGTNVVGAVTRISADEHAYEALEFSSSLDIIKILPEEVARRIGIHEIATDLLTRKNLGTPYAVVITALEEELDYLYDLPLEWSGLQLLQDGLTYRRGRLNEELDIIATSARSLGLTSTAITTAKAIKQWNPKIAALIGICGGRKEKGVMIGDVVVASQCFHYQFGAFENGKIQRELRLENTDSQILDVVEHVARRTQVLAKIQQSLPRGLKMPNTTLRYHIGPIASADLVVKDIEKFAEAIEADRKTIAVDMESYAFMRATRLANTRWSLVLKSVSDYADDNKDDDYREYAKFITVAFFYEVVSHLVSMIDERASLIR